jgi:hypothetical protein
MTGYDIQFIEISCSWRPSRLWYSPPGSHSSWEWYCIPAETKSANNVREVLERSSERRCPIQSELQSMVLAIVISAPFRAIWKISFQTEANIMASNASDDGPRSNLDQMSALLRHGTHTTYFIPGLSDSWPKHRTSQMKGRLDCGSDDDDRS